MTVYYAQQSSVNIDASNMWNTAANGSGSYVAFGDLTSNDVLMANGKTNITINVNTTVNSLRTDTANGATTGGGFILADGITLTANVFAGSSTCVTFSANSPAVGYVVGDGTGGTATTIYGLQNAGTGSLTITGNWIGGSSSSTHGINNASTGSIAMTGNATGGTGVNSCGIQNVSTGVITLTGAAIGSATVLDGRYLNYGVNNAGTGIVTINGSATGGASPQHAGAANSSTGTLTLNGTAYGSPSSPAPGLYGAVAGGLTYAKGAGYASATGAMPFGGHIRFDFTSSSLLYVRDQSLDQRTYIPAEYSVSNGVPAITDVRYGTSYALGALTGTCYIPPAASVLVGVPVDNTVGTAQIGVANVSVNSVVSSDIYQLTKLSANTLSNQNISSPKLLYTYTADTTKELLFECEASNIAGSGDYLFAYTKQTDTGTYQSPTTAEYVGANVTSLIIKTEPVVVDANNIVRVYLQGQVTDTAVDTVVNVYNIGVDKTDYSLTSDYDAAKTASQFNANTDTVARVTLVDTTTTLTNSPIVDNQEIANTVWSTTTRTITGGTVDTLTNSPNVPSANDIASQVRTELTTELTRIDENVSAPKTLTANTLSEIITSMPDGLTAQQVWEYVERTLTDKANFTLSADYDAAKTASQFNANTDTVARVTLVDTTTAITEDVTVTVDLSPISDILTSLEESVDAVYDRIVYSVPEGPAYPIPAPSSSNVTRVYSYCYDVHGRPVSGVPITIKMLDVSNSANKGSYLSDEFTFTSDAYGVASTEIPRGTTFRYRLRSGNQSQWIEFKGVDEETYQLPFLINK